MMTAQQYAASISKGGAIAAVGCLLFVVFQYSNAGVTIPAFLITFYGGLLWGAVWLVRLIVWSVRTQKLEKLGMSVPRRGLLFWALEPLAGIVCLSLVGSGVLPASRLYLSRPALDDCVRRVRAGTLSAPGQLPEPRRVGLYMVTELEHLTNDVVRLITCRAGFDHAGFAYSLGSRPRIIGEDTYQLAGGGWWYWHRSW